MANRCVLATTSASRDVAYLSGDAVGFHVTNTTYMHSTKFFS